MFIIMFTELGFKLQYFTPPQLFRSYFLSTGVSIDQMFHVLVHNNALYYETRFLFQFISKLSITKEAIYIKDQKRY